MFFVELHLKVILIFRDIPYFEETMRFSVALPNKWNFAFYLPNVMRVYLLFLCLPGKQTLFCIKIIHVNIMKWDINTDFRGGKPVKV
jgi:hypothetical protein